MTTANDLLNAGNTADFNNASSINSVGNAAVGSTAPPYVGIIQQSSQPENGTSVPLINALGGEEQRGAFTPQLTPNTTFNYTPIQNNPQDTLNYQQPLPNVTGPVAQGQSTNVGNPTQTSASTYNASQTGVAQGTPGAYQVNPNVGNATAAQGSVDQNSLIQNQFDSVMNSNKDAYGVPSWARTAVTAANQQMTGMGLGNSTMAAGATTAAILNTALPMAQFDAQQYSNMNMLNVSNQQQANITTANNSLQAGIVNLNADQQVYLQNIQNQQQTLLSNASWENAAKQFNASSTQQNNQFFSNLLTSIAQNNATRADAMSQFNSGQTNSMSQFFDNLNSQRQEFNTQNQLLVDQSNVQWQRTINTANTAGQNAANNANVQNTFNMQQTDLNNLWQQARDEASWALTSSENSQNRALTLVNSAMNRQTSLDILNSQLQASMFSQLGSFGVNLLGGLLGGGSGASGLGAGISKLFGNNDGSPTSSSGNAGPGFSSLPAPPNLSPGGNYGDFSPRGGGNAYGYAKGGLITNSEANLSGSNSGGITLKRAMA